MIVGLIMARPGCHSGERLGVWGSFVFFFWPIRARPVGHRVHLCEPCGFVGVVRAGPECRWVHSARALGVVSFILVRWVDSGAP